MSGLKDQLFAPGLSVSEQTDELEKLKSAFAKSTADSDAGRGQFVMKDRVIGRPAGSVDADRIAALIERANGVQKSLGESEQAEVGAMLAELSSMQKDITAGQFPAVGSPGNLRPYDLEAPAKVLVPRFTPLRNELPRIKGQGGAREFRRILGYTNASIGGVPDADIFFNSEATSGLPTFGAIQLRRGNKISYAMDVHTVAYVEASVSDSVTYKAQFSNLGFENSRELSRMALLWSHMLGEEKAILFGRGNSSQGYSGNLGTTVNVTTVVAATAPNAQGAGSYTAVVTQRAGVGETAPGTGPVAVACTSTQGLTVTLPALPAGVYGYNIYIGTSAGTATFAGFSSVGGTTVTLGIPPLAANGGIAVPSSDNTGSNGYDGLLTTLLNPALSGYVSTSPATITTNGDQFAQDAFQSLYQAVYADPDEIWMNAAQRRTLGDYFKKNASTTAYRIVLPSGEQPDAHAGAIVSGIYNQSSPTSKLVDLRTHPYMPVGCAIVRSRTLDIPDSGIGDTTEVVSVQEYMGIEWPEIQFQYDASTYWLGTLVHYAPAWSGAVSGLA